MTKITELEQSQEEKQTVTLTQEQFDELLSVAWSVKEMKSEIESLKAKTDTTPKDPKARYEWPRKYRYQMWWWVPVLSYVSKKKDSTKDLLYKVSLSGGRSDYIDNHVLELTLAEQTKSGDYKTIEVPASDYNRDHEKGEPMEAQVISDWKTTTGIIFTTDKYGIFTISPSVLN